MAPVKSRTYTKKDDIMTPPIKRKSESLSTKTKITNKENMSSLSDLTQSPQLPSCNPPRLLNSKRSNQSISHKDGVEIKLNSIAEKAGELMSTIVEQPPIKEITPENNLTAANPIKKYNKKPIKICLHMVRGEATLFNYFFERCIFTRVRKPEESFYCHFP